jgi:glycosyltransferase involved in cell wall biosynthesis
MTKKTRNSQRIGLVVPHIFMHRDILPRVIFSPGTLALDLAEQLEQLGNSVTLFSPGPIDSVRNETADLSYFESELAARGDSYIDLLKKHPFTFITLARQVQSELIAKAFAMANDDQLDIVHIYTNEEDIALPFAQFCKKPVVFTHHDPFNFLVHYKSVFPKYSQLHWLSMSFAQRNGMPKRTNWVANIYHGLNETAWQPAANPTGGYVAYMGRIIEPKGVHLAIDAIKLYNKTAAKPITLKIAGKHYAEHTKDTYWQTKIEPELNDMIEYVGFIDNSKDKQAFLGNAAALLMPSIFDEPFGMSMIESLACATPVIGLESGAIPEVIREGKTGFIVPKHHIDGKLDERRAIEAMADAIAKISSIERRACRQDFEARFTLQRMASEHDKAYRQLIQSQDQS